MEHAWSSEDEGRRVVYTDRDGAAHLGTVRDVLNTGTSIQIDLKLDKHVSGHRRFYVPSDTVKLVPDEVAKALDNEQE